jgi:hypothetical protein
MTWDRDVDRTIILKWILKKCVSMETWIISLRTASSGSNESGFYNRRRVSRLVSLEGRYKLKLSQRTVEDHTQAAYHFHVASMLCV